MFHEGPFIETEKTPTKWTKRIIFNTIAFLGLIISNIIMVIFVVIEGDSLCNYQYGFSIQLCVWGIIFFLVLYFITTRQNPLSKTHKEVNAFSFKYSGWCGLFWAINYVFLLQANPFTPGFYQTIFNELNIVLVFIASRVFLGKNFYKLQTIAIVIVLIGGLIPLISGFSVEGTNIGWYFIYLIGALAIGVANVICENAMKNVNAERTYSEINEYDNGDQPENQNETVPLISILQYFCATNVWALIFTLAFFLIPMIAYQENFYEYTVNSLGCIFLFQCSSADNQICSNDDYNLAVIFIWASSSLSFLCAAFAAYLSRIDGAIYATLAYTLAPAIATLIFMIPPIMGPYYEPVNWYAIISAVVTFLGVILYKITTISNRFEPPNFQKQVTPVIDLRYNKKFNIQDLTTLKNIN